MMNPFKRLFFPLGIFLLILSGCSAVSRDAVLADLRGNRASGPYIEGVPFFPQNELMCGPAALASVMAYYGSTGGLYAAKEVYAERLKGTLPIDLLIYAKEKGFDASYYRGSIEDLKEKLSKGAPLILFLNLGHELYPIGHYIVALGYNERLGAVVAHSSMNMEEAFPVEKLKKAWSRTGYSTLLLRPKDRPL